ncbi:MAG: hypothetical protein ACYSUK_00195 [Planctomycetota bacterium]|jgi:hypothetical protein
MTITVKYKELSADQWAKLAEVQGLNPWAPSEGLVGNDTEFHLTLKEAKEVGLLEASDE